MKRALVGLLLLFTACAATPEATTSTTVRPSGSIATSSSSTTTSTASSTTSTTGQIGLRPPSPILVSNPDGVFQIDTGGAITQLVYGPVAFAIDDTQGGLLFQVDRGRDWEDFFAEPTPGFDTRVWWVPRGESMARELLVPTPGAGHTLTLYDTYATDDGFAVVYLRHEGEEPPFDGNMADTLRVFDQASGVVMEVARVRGWEWNLDEVSAGGGLIAATEHSIMGGTCRLWNTTGDPVTRAGVPEFDPECFSEGAECPTSCVLSPDGTSVAYSWIRAGDDVPFEWDLAIGPVDGSSGSVRLLVPVAGRWGPGDSDLTAGMILLNRPWEGIHQEPALLLSATDGATPVELPIAGQARFVTALVELEHPVPSSRSATGPDFYRFGDDGIDRIISGVPTSLIDEPVLEVWDDHMGGLLYRTLDWQIHWLADGTTDSTPFSDLVPHDPEERVFSHVFTGVVDGRPTVFYDWWLSSDGTAAEDSVMTCHELQLFSRDLVTGAVAAHMCLPLEDAWFGVRSIGGDLFVGDVGVASGASGTSMELRFWDQDGSVSDLSHNLIPTPCAPCELDARLSPDGLLLAVRHRPDAKWPPAQWDAVPTEEWWEHSQDIPGTVRVIVLSTGEELWEMQIGAGEQLADFDGRYLAVTEVAHRSESPTASVIYDTTGVHEPLQIPGHVVLLRDSARRDGS